MVPKCSLHRATIVPLGSGLIQNSDSNCGILIPCVRCWSHQTTTCNAPLGFAPSAAANADKNAANPNPKGPLNVANRAVGTHVPGGAIRDVLVQVSPQRFRRDAAAGVQRW